MSDEPTNPIISYIPTEPAPLKIVASRQSDQELAEAFKVRLYECVGPLAILLDEMVAAGFEANWQWGRDARGKHFVAVAKIARVF